MQAFIDHHHDGLQTVAPHSEKLHVSSDMAWFRLTDGPKVELGRRRLLQRLLAKLVQERLTSPGRALTVDNLFSAGWPGIDIRPDSKANRVYVAVSTLRKMGLKDVLLRRESGYFLNPGAGVQYAVSDDHFAAA